MKSVIVLLLSSLVAATKLQEACDVPNASLVTVEFDSDDSAVKACTDGACRLDTTDVTACAKPIYFKTAFTGTTTKAAFDAHFTAEDSHKTPYRGINLEIKDASASGVEAALKTLLGAWDDSKELALTMTPTTWNTVKGIQEFKGNVAKIDHIFFDLGAESTIAGLPVDYKDIGGFEGKVWVISTGDASTNAQVGAAKTADNKLHGFTQEVEVGASDVAFDTFGKCK